jgi:hypothetical protein
VYLLALAAPIKVGLADYLVANSRGEKSVGTEKSITG